MRNKVRSILVRSILCAATAVAMLGMTRSSFAEVDAHLEFVNQEVRVHVEGSWPEAQGLSVGFLLSQTETDTPIWADQQTADTLGNITFRLTMNPRYDSGKFRHTLTTQDAKLTRDLEIVSYADLAAIWRKLPQIGSPQEMAEIMEGFSPCLNMEVYNQIDLAPWYEFLFQFKDQSQDPASFYRLMQQGAFLAGLNQGVADAVEQGKINRLELLEPTETAAEAYESQLSSQGIDAVNKHMQRAGFSDIEEAQKKFEELVLVNRITHSAEGDPEQTLVRLRQDGESLGLDMNLLNAVHLPLELCRALIRNGAETLVQLQAEYESLCNTYSQELQPPRGESSGLGGSGSAGTSRDFYNPAPAQPVQASQNGTQIPDIGFSDMQDHAWAAEAVSYLAQHGYINGRGNSLFEPEELITREEFVKLLMEMFPEPETESQGEVTIPYNDLTAEMWCTPYILRATQLGIVNGLEDGIFGLGLPVTRQDMATLAFRTLRYWYNQLPTQEVTETFTDGEEVADYAQTAVGCMSALKVINGYPDGSFRPEDTAIRAEAAQMMYNILMLDLTGGKL